MTKRMQRMFVSSALPILLAFGMLAASCSSAPNDPVSTDCRVAMIWADAMLDAQARLLDDPLAGEPEIWRIHMVGIMASASRYEPSATPPADDHVLARYTRLADRIERAALRASALADDAARDLAEAFVELEAIRPVLERCGQGRTE